MKFCTHCGKEIMDEAVICPGCGCSTVATPPVTQPTTQYHEDDTVSVGLCILAALIPLFGFIYWPVKHRSAPKKARACGITAIIAWVISFVISMIAMVALADLLYWYL